MKLSGPVAVPHDIDPALSRLIARCYPTLPGTGSVSLLNGLSGLTAKVEVGDLTLLARQSPQGVAIPGVDRRREYHILRKMAGSQLGPRVLGCNREWLLLEWLPGETLSEHHLIQPGLPLVGLLGRLHRQPLSGHRLSLLPLLWRYWQLSQPDRRHPRWLRALRRLQRKGEPRPPRLALLHMDIHAGNVIQHQETVKLIDWEYAGDGDVALELAAIVAGNTLSVTEQEALTREYARQQQLDAGQLRLKMAQWQPWLRLLMAGWYELRWQQSGERAFLTLAAKAWQRV